MTPRQKQKNGTYQKRCYLASTILVDIAFWRLTLCVVFNRTMNFRIEDLHVYTELVIIFITKMFIKKALLSVYLSLMNVLFAI